MHKKKYVILLFQFFTAQDEFAILIFHAIVQAYYIANFDILGYQRTQTCLSISFLLISESSMNLDINEGSQPFVRGVLEVHLILWFCMWAVRAAEVLYPLLHCLHW